MKDIHKQSYYELLDIEPTASQEDILKAYNKARATYGHNSPALYSLFNQDEAQQLLKLIDEAYLVLSNQFKRKQYDTSNAHAFKNSQINDLKIQSQPELQLEELAIPSASTVPIATEVETRVVVDAVPYQPPQIETYNNVRTTKYSAYSHDEKFETEMKTIDNFTGSVLQSIRLYKNISLDQISEVTKISRSYLMALERNDFAALPASVFVRGFLVQLAKILDLDSQKVANSYISNMKDTQKK